MHWQEARPARPLLLIRTTQTQNLLARLGLHREMSPRFGKVAWRFEGSRGWRGGSTRYIVNAIVLVS
jgi:hypothetical protein